MISQDIRKRFLDFFREKGHPVVPSSPLVPYGDPTLLFTSAGMVQFKAYYLGLKDDLKRACSCQKCFRTTDIDNVGKTIRHLTFFEMLGNFSFGDYFKEESLSWGYEFLTKEMGINPNNLYFSYYKGGIAPRDDEAYEIWKKLLPEELHSHIFELGEDNFWSMGDTGPSGPSSEIYYDRGEIYHPNCPGPWCGCDRYIEIWNHVFTQFDRQIDGTFKPLPKKNIDTGMGLERLSFVVEGRFSPFETTLFFPIISDFININFDRFNDRNKRISQVLIEKNSSNNYYNFLIELKAFDEFIPAIRIIADHTRAASFLISEGVFPSNEGRGYVLRRLIRRALRYGMLVGVDKPFIYKLVDAVGKIYEGVYPQISQNLGVIKDVVLMEEKSFIDTLEKGERYLSQMLDRGVISGRDAFHIYQTYGFPYELIKEIALKRGIKISDEEFEKAREDAREISRKWTSLKDYSVFASVNDKISDTVFVGYEKLNERARVIALLTSDGRETDFVEKGECFVVFDKTPFYAESGGQIADSGWIKREGNIVGYVKDVQKPFGDVFYHLVDVKERISKGDELDLYVDDFRRRKIASNHTATHIVNAALKNVFGPNTIQAGSYVSDEKFRFDFTLSRSPTYEEIKKVEEIANQAIMEGYKVYKEIRPLSDAYKLGAVLLCGETYSDPARFVLINHNGFDDPFKFSLELCGGTHVDDLKDVFKIKIIKESSVSRGIRRIEGISGYALVEWFEKEEKRFQEVLNALETNEEDVLNKINRLKDEIKLLEDKIRNLSSTTLVNDDVFDVNGRKIVITRIGDGDIKVIRNVADKKRKDFKNAVIFIYGISGDRMSFVLTKGDNESVSVRDIFLSLKDRYNLSGGGREDFIQGGGKPVDIEKFKKDIINILK